MKNSKEKKCKVCGDKFQPFTTIQQTCATLECIKEWERQKSEKKRRKETRLMREKAKSRSDLLKEAQTAFNAFIRYRDRDLSCISCGRDHAGQYHAGHYKTTKAYPELRFHPFNCAKQCAPCNNHLSGNIIEYRKALAIRIGMDNLEWIEGDHHAQNWTRDDIIEIKNHYKQRLKDLQRDNNRE